MGRRLVGTRRHGKYLFLRLTGGSWLAIHFGMTGALAYGRAVRDVPPHTRLLIHFENGAHLAYDSRRKLGKISLIRDPGAFLRRRRLGPDALDPRLTEGRLQKVLAGRRASIKAALLDQHLIAGIGNIYADEVLFQARIDPRTRASRLDRESLRALIGAIRHVLRLAVARHVDPARLPKTWLLPRRSPGGRCPRCRGRLTRLALGGRTAYFCGRCQVRGREAGTSLGEGDGGYRPTGGKSWLGALEALW